MKSHFNSKALLAAAIFAASVLPGLAEDHTVADLQRALKLSHFYYGDVDGNFDCATQSALRRFQFRNGIPGTGEMDEATRETLFGDRPSPKAAGAGIAALAESERSVRASVTANENTARKRELPESAGEREARIIAEEARVVHVPHSAYTEQFPSWSAQHRGVVDGDRIRFESGVEIRRAIPVSRGSDAEEPVISRAASVSQARPIGEIDSPESVITVPAHFTGQDGHVYTYYRKIKTAFPDASRPPGSSYGPGGEAVAPSVVAISRGFAGESIVNR